MRPKLQLFYNCCVNRDIEINEGREDMLKRLIIICMGSILLIMAIPIAASAAKGTVQVHIADFPVKVNGQLINNRQSKYPFIVYKDITYIPLYWDMFIELKLAAEWSKVNGLKVYRDCCFKDNWGYPAQENQPFTQNLTAKNSTSRSYSAAISTSQIEIRGEQIHNSGETYPLLEFRNITYMPLTWKFAHSWLMMDLQWSKDAGLSVWSGQYHVLQQIVYDDDEALYFNALGGKDNSHTMLKIAKSLQDTPEWLDLEQTKIIRDKVDQAAQAQEQEGTQVTIDRIDDILTFQGLPIRPLSEDEKDDSMGTKLVIEGTLYHIDDRRKLLSVITYHPPFIAHIGPIPMRHQLFVIIDGKVNPVAEYPFKPQRVLINANGTVWIARDRMSFRGDFYIPGSGLLAIMDRDGNVHIANNDWNEWDVSPIGLSSPTRDPMEPGGQMIVRLYGKPKDDQTGELASIKVGLYEVDTTLGFRRLSNAPDPEDDIYIYKDSRGDLYTINLYSNTLTNLTQNQYRTWTDVELKKNS
jgi:hypothetical protein